MNSPKTWKMMVPLALGLCGSLLLSACGGQEAPPDQPRLASNSPNKQGLWRMIEEFDGEIFYSTVIVEGTGNNVKLTDCSRAFETDSLALSGNTYSGYNHDLAPLTVINNDTLRWNYLSQTRQFEKMDVLAKFNMGEFTLRSPLLPDVSGGSLVCVQFSKTDLGEVMVLGTRILGNALMITINMQGGFREGTFSIDPYGNEDAMVILAGAHWVYTTLSAHDEVSAGTLTITKRGNVWIEGELNGVLRNGITPVRVNFKAETPVR